MSWINIRKESEQQSSMIKAFSKADKTPSSDSNKTPLSDIDGAKLDGCLYNDKTVWPKGFDVSGKGLVVDSWWRRFRRFFTGKK